MSRPRYVTTRDIVIPAGTTVSRETVRMSLVDAAVVIGGPSKDTHFNWSMAFEDAVALGLVADAAPAKGGPAR